MQAANPADAVNTGTYFPVSKRGQRFRVAKFKYLHLNLLLFAITKMSTSIKARKFRLQK
jgi:hypothetical protein